MLKLYYNIVLAYHELAYIISLLYTIYNQRL